MRYVILLNNNTANITHSLPLQPFRKHINKFYYLHSPTSLHGIFCKTLRSLPLPLKRIKYIKMTYNIPSFFGFVILIRYPLLTGQYLLNLPWSRITTKWRPSVSYLFHHLFFYSYTFSTQTNNILKNKKNIYLIQHFFCTPPTTFGSPI